MTPTDTECDGCVAVGVSGEATTVAPADTVAVWTVPVADMAVAVTSAAPETVGAGTTCVAATADGKISTLVPVVTVGVSMVAVPDRDAPTSVRYTDADVIVSSIVAVGVRAVATTSAAPETEAAGNACVGARAVAVCDAPPEMDDGAWTVPVAETAEGVTVASTFAVREARSMKNPPAHIV